MSDTVIWCGECLEIGLSSRRHKYLFGQETKKAAVQQRAETASLKAHRISVCEAAIAPAVGCGFLATLAFS